jgi:hypothetical protein
MGSNFGGAVIDFDFRTVWSELAERGQPRSGGEGAEELEQKARMDAGVLAFESLGISVNPADAPIRFSDATSRDFDELAYGPINGKTLLLGRELGLSQAQRVEAAAKTSLTRGPVFFFWINDASSTYQFSVFREGKRIRFWSSGEGMHDDEGPPFEVEAGQKYGNVRVQAMYEHLLGVGHFELFDEIYERFTPA